MPEYKNGVMIGGDSATYTDQQWSPQTPPSVENALDDEFNSGALAGWNDFDFGSNVVNSVESEINKLKTVHTWNGVAYQEQMGGVYRDAPRTAGDYGYTAWTRVSISSQDLETFPGVLLIVGEDMSSATGDLFANGLIRNPNPAASPDEGRWICRALWYNAWNSWNSYIGNAETVQSTHIYLRIRVSYVSGTTTTHIWFDYSSDGVGWKALNAGASHNYTGELESIGITTGNSYATVTYPLTTGYFDFFRVYSGYDFNTIPEGRLVKGVLP